MALNSEERHLKLEERQRAEPYLALLEKGLVACAATVSPGACQHWIEALQREQEGVRWALRWLAACGDAGRGMRLAHSVLGFWSARHRVRRASGRELRRAGAPAVVVRDIVQSEHALARMLCAESWVVVATIGRRRRRAAALAHAARAALAGGGREEAYAGLRAAARMYRLLGSDAAAAECTRLAHACEPGASPSERSGQLSATHVRLSPLSPREQQVAMLIARGCTSSAIAGELHITERTARTHVTHILDKLGVRSRAQIAAWVVASRPEIGVIGTRRTSIPAHLKL